MKKINSFILSFSVWFLFSFKIFAFELTEIDEGVYVHFGKQENSNKLNKGDIANLGLIIGSHSAMVIDTGGTPKIGNAFKHEIAKITSLPISHIIITHGHPDHFFGTEEFEEFKPEIVGHEKLDRSLLNNFEFYKNLQFSITNDDSMQNVKLVMTTQSIKTEESLIIDLGERLVEIKAWKSGHTDNDISIYDIKTKIFWSEMIFVERTPSIRASIKGWKSNLKKINDMDINLIVPGHGPVKTKNEAIKPMMNYFDRLITQAREYHKMNKTLEEAQKNIGSENLENWKLYEDYNVVNVTRTYTELEWE